MKTEIRILLAALLLAALDPQLSTVFAQGNLTPPGPPAPTMKSLAQVEPRTPIASVPFNITNSGSYYLTTNLNVAAGDAITISANGVTLDLNGFTVSSTAPGANGTGILLSADRSAIHILNGHIKGGVTNNAGVYSGSGFLSGIFYSGGQPVNVRVAGVSVSGCLGDGIILGLGDSTVVESCTVRTVGSSGILANTVSRCAAKECGANAIWAITASDCSGASTGSFYGLRALTANNCSGLSSGGDGLTASTANNCYGVGGGIGISTGDGGTLIGCTAMSSFVGIGAGNGCTIKDCTASQNTKHGIQAGDGSTIQGCTATANGGLGFSVRDGCVVTACAARQNGSHGFSVQAVCTISACSATANSEDGINLASSGNRIVENICSLNGSLGGTNFAGIRAAGGNQIEGNRISGNRNQGIVLEGAYNLVIKNFVSGHGPNDYILINTNQTVGPFAISPASGTQIATNHPWANFSF